MAAFYNVALGGILPLTPTHSASRAPNVAADGRVHIEQ